MSQLKNLDHQHEWVAYGIRDTFRCLVCEERETGDLFKPGEHQDMVRRIWELERLIESLVDAANTISKEVNWSVASGEARQCRLLFNEVAIQRHESDCDIYTYAMCSCGRSYP